MAERDLMLSRPQRWAIGGVALAAGCLLAYGVAGSYTSVAHLASTHDVPLPRLVPVGIDGGLVGTVLLDIVLTWTGFPVRWLRWLCHEQKQLDDRAAAGARLETLVRRLEGRHP